jgi:hypothetical protein
MPPKKSPAKAPTKHKTMSGVAAAAAAAKKPANKKQKKADKEEKEEKSDDDADDDDDEKRMDDNSYGQLHRTGFIMSSGETGVPLVMRVKRAHAQLAREDGIIGTILCPLSICVCVCVCMGGKHGVSKPISLYIDPTFCL